MTTVIIVIIAVVLLAALAKTLMKGSSSGKKGASSDSDKSASSSEKDKKSSSVIKKVMSMSADIGVKSTDLFRPPPEPEFFSGRKEEMKIILAQASTSPAVVWISGFSGVGKTCLAITMIGNLSPQFPASACL